MRLKSLVAWQTLMLHDVRPRNLTHTNKCSFLVHGKKRWKLRMIQKSSFAYIKHRMFLKCCLRYVTHNSFHDLIWMRGAFASGNDVYSLFDSPIALSFRSLQKKTPFFCETVLEYDETWEVSEGLRWVCVLKSAYKENIGKWFHSVAHEDCIKVICKTLIVDFTCFQDIKERIQFFWLNSS